MMSFDLRLSEFERRAKKLHKTSKSVRTSQMTAEVVHLMDEVLAFAVSTLLASDASDEIPDPDDGSVVAERLCDASIISQVVIEMKKMRELAQQLDVMSHETLVKCLEIVMPLVYKCMDHQLDLVETKELAERQRVVAAIAVVYPKQSNLFPNVPAYNSTAASQGQQIFTFNTAQEALDAMVKWWYPQQLYKKVLNGWMEDHALLDAICRKLEIQRSRFSVRMIKYITSAIEQAGLREASSQSSS